MGWGFEKDILKRVSDNFGVMGKGLLGDRGYRESRDRALTDL